MEDTPPTRSIWNRFWSPRGMLESIPAGADAVEADDIAHRNNVWLKTYMDMYVLRWAGLFLASLVASVLTHNDEVPLVVNGVFVLLSIVALAGLVVMIRTYRRAAAAVRRHIGTRGG